jgi:hypothetical protein
MIALTTYHHFTQSLRQVLPRAGNKVFPEFVGISSLGGNRMKLYQKTATLQGVSACTYNLEQDRCRLTAQVDVVGFDQAD